MAIVVSPAELQALEDCLLNKNGDAALHTRFRALFTLKSLKSEEAVQIIAKGMINLFFFYRHGFCLIKILNQGFKDHSALLKHELAYCLGQIKKTSALPALESVLRDTSEDPMVRHEVSFINCSLLNERSMLTHILLLGCRSHGSHL